MLQLVDTLRTNLPTALDLRPTLVVLRRTTWSGREVGDGTASYSDMPLTPRPNVRDIKSNEINASAGRYQSGDVMLEGITPAYTLGVLAGGYTEAQLAPVSVQSNVEYVWALSGFYEGEYQYVSTHTRGLFSHDVVLRRRLTTP
jgi:hypothetical protein